MTMRIKDWESALSDFLLSYEKVQFVWGKSDCCLIAADAVNAISGVDIASEFRGKYTTQLGAFQSIAQVAGGKTAEDAVAYCADKHGLVEWQYPLCAQRGDLVLVRSGDDLIGGFVHLNGKHLISIGETGLIRLPITAVHRAWKV